ncbi:hypothetical protein QF035_002783 [Streptomyces umbrinus]|uniref:Uncharacterized protein n=1 Tax=Streptomyces umbrinus TaxID=67370 RepID=A0ABU0SNR0_9ACTN|nr:hypothetical protein [Streptomyces umbrinus]
MSSSSSKAFTRAPRASSGDDVLLMLRTRGPTPRPCGGPGGNAGVVAGGGELAVGPRVTGVTPLHEPSGTQQQLVHGPPEHPPSHPLQSGIESPRGQPHHQLLPPHHPRARSRRRMHLDLGPPRDERTPLDEPTHPRAPILRRLPEDHLHGVIKRKGPDPGPSHEHGSHPTPRPRGNSDPGQRHHIPMPLPQREPPPRLTSIEATVPPHTKLNHARIVGTQWRSRRRRARGGAVPVCQRSRRTAPAGNVHQ